MNDCIFCRIARGEMPAKLVREGPEWIAFRDIAPRAPTHILVIPRSHVASLAGAASTGQTALLGELLRACAEVAEGEGLSDRGYRVVTNVGAEGGQTVGHLHFHVLGGRPMAWPPG